MFHSGYSDMSRILTINMKYERINNAKLHGKYDILLRECFSVIVNLISKQQFQLFSTC